MNFNLTPEQRALADSVARFCERDYTFDKRKAIVSSGAGFSAEHWHTFAELGWLGAGLSEEAGGYGGGPVENMIIMEQFGKALVVEPFLPTAILSLQTLTACQPSETRDALVASIVSGEEKIAFAHNEAASGGDITRIETRVQNGCLTGIKSLVLGAPAADRLIVSANSDNGVGLYLVDPQASRLQMTPYRTLDNKRAADINLDKTPVEAELAAPGTAWPAIETGHAHALVALCAEAIGSMDASILITRDYLKTRTQFGVTLNNFQALQHRMSDMLVEAELSRSILYQGTASLDQSGTSRQRALSAMKVIVSSAAMFVGRNAVQLHGGIGVTEELVISHHYRRLFVIANLFGSEAAHLKLMAANPQPFWPEHANIA